MTRRRNDETVEMTVQDAATGDPGSPANDDSAAQKRRQRMRSIAIALALAFLVMLFYAATLIRLGGKVLERTV
jgi:hypothetical protein